MLGLRPKQYRYLAHVVVTILLAIIPLMVAEPVTSAPQCPLLSGWIRLESPEHSGLPRDPMRVWPRLYSVAASWDAPSVLYAGGARGLHRSDDCGLTWSTVHESPPSSSPGVRPGAAVKTFSIGWDGRA